MTEPAGTAEDRRAARVRIAVLAVVLFGGHVGHWSWTGRGTPERQQS